MTTPIGFEAHDHRRCIQQGLRAAEAHAAREGLRFTDTRRRVLEILLQEHRAIGAYDILALLGKEGRAAQPPVAYRALEFLVRNGFAHKIERLNAWVACAHPHEDHTPAFLICRGCDTVAEAEVAGPKDGLEAAAQDAGFHIERAVVEAVGLCPACGEDGTEGSA